MNARLSLLVAALALFPRQVSADEPTRLARSARFDILASASVKALGRERPVEGAPTIARMHWLPEAERPGGYTVEFPIDHRGWHRAAVAFVPEHSGEIVVRLMGPWEQSRPGVLYREEVLWDEIQVEGTEIANGGFEATGGKPTLPRDWSGSGDRIVQTRDVPAAQGAHYARTWHNRPLSQTIHVQGGRPVIIRLNARASRPAGLVEMKRIVGKSTGAHRAARHFLRGANLGNDLEVPPGETWSVHHTTADLARIKAEGFDHIRIPIGWHHETGPAPEFRIRPEFFGRVDELVHAGLGDGLAVIINIHHFNEFTTDPKERTPQFLAIWDQIAAHYAREPKGLAFELLNEPKDTATTEVMNPIYAEAIRRIRRFDPDRTIFLGPGRWNGVGELESLRLPDDENLIVTVHNYDPFYFTHQGSTWSGPDTKVTGIVFPGPPRQPLVPAASIAVSRHVADWIRRYNTEPTATNPSAPHVVQEAIETARRWSEYYGRPIHFGEFGCLTTADRDSRENYYRTFREAAEKAGIGWCLWDWKAGFRYWNEPTGRPKPGMREALFGGSERRSSP